MFWDLSDSAGGRGQEGPEAGDGLSFGRVIWQGEMIDLGGGIGNENQKETARPRQEGKTRKREELHVAQTASREHQETSGARGETKCQVPEGKSEPWMQDQCPQESSG